MSDAQFSHRILLSLPEAAKIIGVKGSTVEKIRNDNNNVKINITEAVNFCSDRILTAQGSVIDVANALGDIVSTIIKQDDSEDLRNKKYPFPFLNNILPPPTSNELKGNENNDDNNDSGNNNDGNGDENQQSESNIDNIGTLRLILPNTFISPIIGTKGETIKSLIDKHGVKIVASKDFLPDSRERILEIQGFSGSISNALIEITEILINDESVDISSVERRYWTHISRSRQNANNSNNNNNNQNNNTNNAEPVLLEVLIPEEFVGAVVGRGGNRIANLRKFTTTRIDIGKPNENDKLNDNGENCRVFTVTSSSMKNCELAQTMLLQNLQTERERRQAVAENAN